MHSEDALWTFVLLTLYKPVSETRNYSEIDPGGVWYLHFQQYEFTIAGDYPGYMIFGEWMA